MLTKREIDNICRYYQRGYDAVRLGKTGREALNITDDDAYAAFVNGVNAGRAELPSGTLRIDDPAKDGKLQVVDVKTNKVVCWVTDDLQLAKSIVYLLSGSYAQHLESVNT